MPRLKKTGIAKVLAILLLSVLAPMVNAQDLTLPQDSAEPLTLSFPESHIAAEALRVYVQGGSTPIAGRYLLEDHTLSFVPAFGFEPGQEYVARLVLDGEESEVAFSLPSNGPGIFAAVTDFFPSGDRVPENTLRFYIHFSVPMQPQVAFDYIELRDAAGNVDPAAFMRFKQELWNNDRTRLTILIDPGRIKRAVATNVELGPALLSGNAYTLVVNEGWPSADGRSILPGFSRTFAVSEALRRLPDVELWRFSKPCVGSRTPLEIWFDRPFDRHQLMREIFVVGGNGSTIRGTPFVGSNEMSWRFIPDEPWDQAVVSVVANQSLEDVAGNNFFDLLDQAKDSEEPTPKVSKRVVLSSTCAQGRD